MKLLTLNGITVQAVNSEDEARLMRLGYRPVEEKETEKPAVKADKGKKHDSTLRR